MDYVLPTNTWGTKSYFSLSLTHTTSYKVTSRQPVESVGSNIFCLAHPRTLQTGICHRVLCQMAEHASCFLVPANAKEVSRALHLVENQTRYARSPAVLQSEGLVEAHGVVSPDCASKRVYQLRSSIVEFTACQNACFSPNALINCTPADSLSITC